jgi:hypothetical protein
VPKFHAPVAPPDQPLWQRIAFRYLLCHWVLYALPGLLVDLHEAIAAAWRHHAADGAVPEWFTIAGSALQAPDRWCCAVTAWIGQQSWSPIAVVPREATGMFDTSHAWMRLFCIVVFAAVLAVAWSMLDRGKRPLLGRWLHLGARWWVGLVLFGAGTAKLYTWQTQGLSFSQLNAVTGQQTTLELAQTFFSASPLYLLFGGALEVLGGVLLLHHRTALLGAFVSAVVLTNILALNLFYDMPSKLYAAHLLLASILVLAPWSSRLWAVLVSNRFSESIDVGITRSKVLAPLLVGFGLAWLSVDSYALHLQHRSPREATAQPQPSHAGIWDVVEMAPIAAEPTAEPAAGAPTAPAPEPIPFRLQWRTFVVDRDGKATVQTADGEQLQFTLAQNADATEITLQPVGEGKAEAPADPKTAVVFQVTRTAEARHGSGQGPAGQVAESVGVETLVLRGDWQGRRCLIKAHLRARTLEVRFDWVQDALPEHR